MRHALSALLIGLAIVLGGCTPVGTGKPDGAATATGGIPGLPGSDQRTVPAQAAATGDLVAWSAEQSVQAGPATDGAALADAPPPVAEAAAPRRGPFGFLGLGRRSATGEAATAAPVTETAAETVAISETALPVAPPPTSPPTSPDAAEVAAAGLPEAAASAATAAEPAPERKPLFSFLGLGKRKAADAPAADPAAPGAAAFDTNGDPLQSATVDVLPATGSATGPATDAANDPAKARTPEQDADLIETATTPAPEVPEALKSAAQRACERGGGTYSKAKSAFLCVRPTRDAGKSCRTGRDCDGYCLARSRTCAPIAPLLGCHEIILDNGVRTTQCLE
ncbi:hypothetical protein E7811_02920 [Aliigemmobacter aestuarii]|uniref:Uncharacterized protein n=1 Tax=Aliigemmobacter aestuarii TaxID=1445661 RepID=A0A4S3MRK5_9RHOB|nr:hypothetical protein [Gemmobacter aestuarii]THD84703.1 hypothetical protein E7811_02920 [Gemmobacter aestuarii]